MAVSFGKFWIPLLHYLLDNRKITKENEENKVEKEGSYVMIYVHRDSNKLTGKIRTPDNNLFLSYAEIKNASIYETYQTESK